mgnify:CR=1 FL=1
MSDLTKPAQEAESFSRAQERGTANPDAVTPLAADTVTEWEFQLAGELVFTHGLTGSPLSRVNAGTERRIGTEYEVTVSLAVAYTGLDAEEIRRAVVDAGGVRPAYGYGDGPQGRGGR